MRVSRRLCRCWSDRWCPVILAAPGDPIYAIAGQSGDAAYYADMRVRYGLDQLLALQFGRYLLNAAQEQFGYSFAYSGSGEEPRRIER